MALQKPKTIDRGDVVTYWRWVQQNRSDLSRTAQYVLGGWKDRDEREAYPAQPSTWFPFNWSGADYPFSGSDPDAAIAYNTAKLPTVDPDTGESVVSFFADAVDC